MEDEERQNRQKMTQVNIESQETAEHLSKAIQFKTISYQDTIRFDNKEFLNLHGYLVKTFPNVHSTLTKENIGELSLLYTWKGKDESMRPILLAAHMDVVPITLGTEGDWTYPPFDGHIDERCIWGRGALDDKSSVLGILEAVELLLKDGFQPSRTILLAFGHDEEVGGHNGATKIAEVLSSKGIELEYIIDEGFDIIEGIVPGIPTGVALIGITEKGHAVLELTTELPPVHAMGTSQSTSIGILSTAIHKLEQYRFPLKLTDPIRQTLSNLAPRMPFPLKIILQNLWLFSGLIKKQYAASPQTEASIRTTAVAREFSSSGPFKSTAMVLLSILPTDSIDNTINRIRKIIDDPRVRIKIKERTFAYDSPPASPTDSLGYGVIKQTISELFPEVLVAPSLAIVATDSRHYAGLTRNVYRFQPLRLNRENIREPHGTNEKVPIDDYVKAIEFYSQLIRNSAL